jgi:hypothetical protein
MKTRKLTIRSLWTVCAWSLGLLAGCGNDPEKHPAASIDQAVDLDCTDELDGRPDDLLDDQKEIYVPKAIKKVLAEDAVLRERFGADEIHNCAEARRFTDIYLEEEERISAEWLEKNPPHIPAEGDVLEANPDDFPVDGVPVPDDEMDAVDVGAGGATAVETGAAPGAAGAEGGAGAVEIVKILNGNNRWSYAPTLKYSIPNVTSLCSATAISARHLLTAAHCVQDGEFMTTISQQQKVAGAQPTLLFKGAIKVQWKRDENWLTNRSPAHDIAVGQTVSASHTFTDTTGMYLGSVYTGDLSYLFGYGRISPSYSSPGVFHWGQGNVEWVGTAYYYVEADIGNQGVCLGDSGGFAGTTHGVAWFSQDAVLASGDCVTLSRLTKISYHIDFITGLVEKAAGCIDLWDGWGMERWCY